MPNIVITGAAGFIGKNLSQRLRDQKLHQVFAVYRTTPPETRAAWLAQADVVFHLAGVNRPPDPGEFLAGNAGFTATVCAELAQPGRRPLLVLTSSIQAAQDNPYGASKRRAEEIVEQWSRATGGRAVACRLANVFGKWCRPHYNSAVATFCHQLTRGLPVTVSDPARNLELVYVDDVVADFLRLAEEHLAAPPAPAGGPPAFRFREVAPVTRLTLQELVRLLESFQASRVTLTMPSLADAFTRALYATYLSHLEGPQFAYVLNRKTDPRGSLAEFIKQPHFGQVFISRTAPGITRGHHFHHTKTEKFFVVEGDAIVRFQQVVTGETVAHRVSGTEFKVIDIPPGQAHSIENVGPGELVTLFWASEIFDPAHPDTFSFNVPQSAPPAAHLPGCP